MDSHAYSTSRRFRSAVVAVLVFVAGAAPASAEMPVSAESPAGKSDLVAQGRRIYESGASLSATSVAGQVLKGEAAACVRCHRRSGMGMFEGSRLVPAITGPALFEGRQPLRTQHYLSPSSKHKDLASLERPNYDASTLGRAIRDGINAGGVTLDVLMPRYTLSDADLAALTAYLKTLSAEPSPGIDESGPHFATVVTPDVSPERAGYMAEVLETCFAARYPDASGTDSRWKLHVWQLTGEEETWGAQLDAALAARPVFALVSGLGNAKWRPVHAFCEKNGVPCLLPNVSIPGGGMKEDAYNFYFSGGVLLEAQVAARYIGMIGATRKLSRIVQVYEVGNAGAQAAAELKTALAAYSSPFEIVDKALEHATPESLASAVAGLGPQDGLLLWLDGASIAALSNVPAPGAGLVLLSGSMAGVETAPVPASWRPTLEMIYPYDAPQRRDDRMAFNLRPWLAEHGLPDTDEVLAGNTLAACNVLVESVARMRGFNHRDFLVERIEDYPVGMGNAPAPQAFPRFEAGIGQRFSSRGAYIARFSATEAGRMDLVHDWIVP